MSRYVLHNPLSHAHLEDLRDRLARVMMESPRRPEDPSRADAVVKALTDVVRAFDRGSLSPEDTRAVFDQFHLPGFRFDTWLDEMLDKGVYLEGTRSRAA
ncbi:hypothetical protein FHG66_16770 [Rubellimicrobium rubrum]|uniref:Uncharacterized protein n=1 Tax=Rubellimicrobium rubrum TaxID=2585369 RepID=A0A5C4MS13_9RHOB|nr:hypothetical protein [Rubellimicrobium rubrum]TNC47399.1 hypothetical protein FHG66_16770 [Rubellimicrobium rubrum]